MRGEVEVVALERLGARRVPAALLAHEHDGRIAAVCRYRQRLGDLERSRRRRHCVYVYVYECLCVCVSVYVRRCGLAGARPTE